MRTNKIKGMDLGNTEKIQSAQTKFGVIISEQLARIERMKLETDWVDYSKISPIIVGMLGGDGIGPTISEETRRVLEYLMRDAIKNDKVKFETIDGLTIENRAKQNKAIPDDVIENIKK